MMTLDHWGLSPERDKIQMRVIGDQSVLVQSLNAGLIDGSVWGYAYNAALQRSGGRLLADLTALNIPYQGTGLVARRAFIASSPDVVEKTLRGFVKANKFRPGQKQSSGGGAQHSQMAAAVARRQRR